MHIPLTDLCYFLPDTAIAKYPLPKRDASRLLVYQNDAIAHKNFIDLPEVLPAETLLVFNDTRVIPARLVMPRSTGSLIEILLLNALSPMTSVGEALQINQPCVWACIVGNKKRWKPTEILTVALDGGTFTAAWHNHEQNEVYFTWDTHHTLHEALEALGKLPLPPYLNRATEADDAISYQTTYAQNAGAVAAPTAGLHFTEKVLNDLTIREIKRDFLTLHVGAGTFKPVKTPNALDHEMHAEEVIFTQENIIKIITNLGHIIPVGTTSMRSLESLYWLGVLLKNGANMTDFHVPQFVHQQFPEKSLPSPKDALENLLDLMKKANLQRISGNTAIMIFPGYKFRLCIGLITNFHQPESTLLLLIGALVGEKWREIYAEALSKGYRFLSYGDSSLLLPS